MAERLGTRLNQAERRGFDSLSAHHGGFMKWRYLVRDVEIRNAETDLDDRLEALGEEGWELVAVDGGQMFFKRPGVDLERMARLEAASKELVALKAQLKKESTEQPGLAKEY